MTLTSSQTKDQDRATLEALVEDLMSARRNDDPTAARVAREALIAFNSRFRDLNAEAQNAAAAAILANMNEALGELTQIAVRLGPLGDAFRAAQKLAREGKKELFIPRLAATAAQALELLTVLKEAADKISDQLDVAGQANDLADIQTALANVLSELKKLRDAAQAVSTN